MDFKYSKRRRNGRTYITIKKDSSGFEALSKELKKQYPEIRITSGGTSSVTGVIDILEILKRK